MPLGSAQDFESAQTFIQQTQHQSNFVYDADATVSRAIGVSELPTVIIIDRDFNYNSKHVAYEPGTESRIAEEYSEITDRLVAN